MLPRRNRTDLYTPAEIAILDAIDAVEVLGADTRLTDAVILLGDAKSKVADYIDDQLATCTPPPAGYSENRGLRSLQTTKPPQTDHGNS